MSTEIDAGASTTRDPGEPEGCLQLRAGGVGLILDCTGDRLPRVLHWGPDLGPLSVEELEDLRRACEPPLVSGQPDVVVPVSLLPEQSAGWLGTPGLSGHRSGADFSTRFTVTAIAQEHPDDPTVSRRVAFSARDDAAQLSLSLTVEMLDSGLVRLRAAVTNTGERGVRPGVVGCGAAGADGGHRAVGPDGSASA